MVSLSLLARGSYLDLDVLYGRPCKWTTVLPILVYIYILGPKVAHVEQFKTCV